MLCSFTRQTFLRTCLFVNVKTKPYIFLARVRNLYFTVWPSDRSTEEKGKVLQASHCTVISSPTAPGIHLRKKVMSLKTIGDLLEFFDASSSLDAVNRLTILHNIAKTVQKETRQQRALSQEKKKCAYINLLDSFVKDVPLFNPRDLADIIWALGKIQETGHNLVAVCEKEILSRDISVFSNTQVCQILNGCSFLGMKGAAVLSKIGEAILQGKLNLSLFEDWQLSGALMSYAKTGKGSEELFGHLKFEILKRDFMRFDNRSLVGFVWSFGKQGLFEKELFFRVEDEILRRGSSGFTNLDIVMMLTAFAKATGMYNGHVHGSSDHHQHRVQTLQLFDMVETELLRRGLAKFKASQLASILWSFIKVERNSQRLMRDCLNELFSRDLTHLDNGSFSRLAWCMGRSGLVDHKLFDKIEQIVLQRNALDFNLEKICALQRGFIEAERGSRELFYHLESATIPQIKNLSADAICELLWCVSRPGVESNSVISAIEKEILRQGESYFKLDQRRFMKACFVKSGVNRSELFQLLDGKPK